MQLFRDSQGADVCEFRGDARAGTSRIRSTSAVSELDWSATGAQLERAGNARQMELMKRGRRGKTRKSGAGDWESCGDDGRL